MHSIDSSADRPAPTSNLRATLRRLHRHLEGNRHREQAALEIFGTWRERWSDSRDMIAQQLEWLNQELSQLKTAAVPVPQLSLLGAVSDDAAESVSDQDTVHAQDDDSESGIISSTPGFWNGAQLPR